MENLIGVRIKTKEAIKEITPDLYGGFQNGWADAIVHSMLKDMGKTFFGLVESKDKAVNIERVTCTGLECGWDSRWLDKVYSRDYSELELVKREGHDILNYRIKSKEQMSEILKISIGKGCSSPHPGWNEQMWELCGTTLNELPKPGSSGYYTLFEWSFKKEWLEVIYTKRQEVAPTIKAMSFTLPGKEALSTIKTLKAIGGLKVDITKVVIASHEEIVDNSIWGVYDATMVSDCGKMVPLDNAQYFLEDYSLEFHNHEYPAQWLVVTFEVTKG